MDENNHHAVKIAPSGSPWSRFWSRFVSEPEPTVAHKLYDRLVRHARFPIYYGTLGVPDTPECRFEILALHVGLTVRQLYNHDQQGRVVGQALFDLMIADLDVNLRELGVGDLSVGKQVKRLAGQFYARLAVLNDTFDGVDKEPLTSMLKTNIYGAASAPNDHVAKLADIVEALNEALDRQPSADLAKGRIVLPDEQELAGVVAGQRNASAADETA